MISVAAGAGTVQFMLEFRVSPLSKTGVDFLSCGSATSTPESLFFVEQVDGSVMSLPSLVSSHEEDDTVSGI